MLLKIKSLRIDCAGRDVTTLIGGIGWGFAGAHPSLSENRAMWVVAVVIVRNIMEETSP